MKQIKLFSMVLLLATMFIGFTACSDDDDDKKDESYEKLIIGRWKLIVDDEEIEHLVFKTDGIMTWGYDDVVTDYARYKIKGNTLYLLWSDSDVIENESKEWWNKGISSEWQDVPILELDSNTLILDWGNGDGSDGTYKIIK